MMLLQREVRNADSFDLKERLEFTLLFNYILKNNFANCVNDYMLQDEGIQIMTFLVTQ